jgi:hypothetical protein
MRTIGLAEREIERISWGRLKEANGSASEIGPALRRMLDARGPQEASTAYWQLENHVVVQGEVFEAAEATVSVLVAAFADERPRHVRIAALELLYQILAGEPNQSQGDQNLLVRCRERAREGLWLLIRELTEGEHDAALDVLRFLLDEDRLDYFTRDASQQTD